MIRYIIKYSLICIFLCAPFFSRAQQDSLFEVAQQFAENGSKKRAVLEYERIAFLTDSPAEKVLARIRKAEVLGQMYAYEKALKTLLSTPPMFIGDSLKAEYLKKTAFFAILNENFRLAEGQFKRLHFEIEDKSLYQDIILLEVTNQVQLKQFHQADSLLVDHIQNQEFREAITDSLIAISNNLFSRENLPRIKNPEKAERLSTFIPGAGQMYAGYVMDGLQSIFFQLASLSVAAYFGYYGYYFTGYFGGLAVFQKFYFGGKTRAAYLARKRTKAEMADFNNDLKKLLDIIAEKKAAGN